MINEFKGDHFFLSNFYPSPIEWHDHTYPTMENFFQAMKTDDPAARDALSWCSPKVAKHIGRNLKLREDWDRQRVIFMQSGISMKFQDSPELREKLKATGTEVLVEGNYWHDQYWGSCYCPRHKSTPGTNALGILLMAERLKS